ncbi:Retrovirus-related Pol polyprotein from transposon TNT 1-94 [Fusarium oxysporum f. sp. albedinis]|nr:Retrovirus-related Pol polyprotein from transposon TNT 1-94 [Fusarium oxysporum f. sp. albedinis]
MVKRLRRGCRGGEQEESGYGLSCTSSSASLKQFLLSWAKAGLTVEKDVKSAGPATDGGYFSHLYVGELEIDLGRCTTNLVVLVFNYTVARILSFRMRV